MPFVVYCTDDPQSGNLRKRTRAIHLEYMIANKHNVLYGGPLQTDDGTVIGSLMVLQFDRRQDVDIFLGAEPYSQSGLFSEVRIFRLRQMVPESPPGLLMMELERERAIA